MFSKTMRGLTISALLTLFSVAEDFKVPLEKGKALFDDGKFNEALIHFQEAFQIQPDDLDVNYYLGVTYSELGDYEPSFMAFDRMLIVDPELGRAKLELAKTCYNLKLYDLAEQYFNDVLKVGLPPLVEENVRSFLSRIDDDRRHHYFSGKLSLSVGRDSNIYSASNGLVSVKGINVDFPKEDGWGFSQSLDLRHEYRYFVKAPHVWVTDLYFLNNMFDTTAALPTDELNLSVQYYRFRTGPRFNYEDFSWDIKFLSNYIYAGNDDFMGSYGVSSGLSYTLTDNIWLAGTVSTERRNYFDLDGQNGHFWRVNFGPTFLYDKNMLSITGGVEEQDADEAKDSFQRLNISVFYLRQLPWRMNWTAGFTFSKTDYDGPDTNFGERRDDNEEEWSTSLSKLVTNDLLLQFTFRHTRNSSSLDPFNYERQETLFSMVYSF